MDCARSYQWTAHGYPGSVRSHNASEVHGDHSLTLCMIRFVGMRPVHLIRVPIQRNLDIFAALVEVVARPHIPEPLALHTAQIREPRLRLEIFS